MNSSERRRMDRPDRLEFASGVQVLELRVPVGRINVIGTDGPATLEVNRISGEPLQVGLCDGTLTVTHGSATGIVNRLLSGRRRQEVDLSLGLAPDTRIALNVVSGTVVVSNFHEQVTVHGVSGDVTLAGMYGSATVRTVSGAITAEQVTGDIDARGISGAIIVIAGAGGRIALETVSGALTVDLADPMPTDIDLACISGAVTVRLPHKPDVRVDLNTTYGPLTSTVAELGSGGRHRGGRLTGQLGAGRARLHGNTVSGALTLLRRNADDDDFGDLDDAVAEYIPNGKRNEESR